jgi:hypothetical protein
MSNISVPEAALSDKSQDTILAEKGKERIPDYAQLEISFREVLNTPAFVASDIKNGKVPKNPYTDSSNAMPNDQKTWGTFGVVKKYSTKKPDHYPAIALPATQYTIIDLDSKKDKKTGAVITPLIDPVTGNIVTWALDILNRFAPFSYIETSVSGTGFHIVCKGNKPGSRCKIGGQTEIYDSKNNKFITLTGNVWNGNAEIKGDASEEIAKFYNETFPKEKEVASEECQKLPFRPDADVIGRLYDLCKENPEDEKNFHKLFEDGDISGHPSESEADQSLCNFITRETDDKEQVDRVFRRSKLYLKKDDYHLGKWERKDYREGTIEKALSRSQKYRAQHKETTSLMETIGAYSDIANVEFPVHALPECLKEAVTEVARANKVDPALPALPGIGVAALQIGKKALIHEKLGLTHHTSEFLCGVAESGERKSQTFDKMTEGLKEAMHQAESTYRKEKAKTKAHNDAVRVQLEEAKKALAKLSDLEGKDAEKIKHKIGELTLAIRPEVAEPKNFFSDITPQRIIQKLEEHGGAFGVLTGEGRGVLSQIMGKGSTDGSTQDNVFLACTWGDDYSRSRVSSTKGTHGGEDINLKKPALTTICFVQPDIWKDVCRDGRLRASGFIARVQVAYVPSTIGTRLEEKEDTPFDKSKMRSYEQALIALWRWNPKKPLEVFLDEDAQERRREFHNLIEKDLQIGGVFEDVRDIASKAVSLACKNALTFKLLQLAAENPQSLDSLEKVFVSEAEWLNAQEIQEYFLGQAILSQRENSAYGSAHKLARALAWIQRKCPNGESFTPRELARGLGRGTRSDEGQKLCNKLLEQKNIRQVSNPLDRTNKNITYVLEREQSL